MVPNFPDQMHGRDVGTYSLFIYLYGPLIFGFLLGLFLAVEHRITSNRNYKAAKSEFVELAQGRETELQSISSEIVKVFEEKGFKVVDRTDRDIVFRKIPRFDPTGFDIAMLTILTMGGVLGFLVAMHFFGRLNERVSLRLVPD